MKGIRGKPSPMIRPRPSGNWEARYRDRSGRLRGKTFARKTDAAAFIAATKVDMRRGTWIDPARGEVVFEELANRWLDTKLNLRVSTRATDEGCVRNHIVPVFGETPVGWIERSDVQAWIADMVKAGVGVETVRRCHRLLKSILAEAVDAGVIAMSPCRRITLPRVVHREQRYLTAEEVERLLAAVDPRHSTIVACAAYLGCRWGELAGLKRSSLNLVRRELRVVGTLEEVGGQPMRSKTRTSRRTLSLPPFLAAMLQEHLATAPPAEFVFVTAGGDWHRRSVFRRAWFKPALREAGLDEDLRFHDLRHTAAGLLIAQGAHPKEIQARLGHASITTTLNTYGHLWPSLGAALDEKIESVHQAARQTVVCLWSESDTRSEQTFPEEEKSGR